jgi:hypothetical protein
MSPGGGDTHQHSAAAYLGVLPKGSGVESTKGQPEDKAAAAVPLPAGHISNVAVQLDLVLERIGVGLIACLLQLPMSLPVALRYHPEECG